MNLTPSVRAAGGTNERMTPAGGCRILCASERSGGRCAQLFWLSGGERQKACRGRTERREGTHFSLNALFFVSAVAEFRPVLSSTTALPPRPTIETTPSLIVDSTSKCATVSGVFLRDSPHVLMHTHTHTLPCKGNDWNHTASIKGLF